MSSGLIPQIKMFLANLSGVIYGRISGLAGYRISGNAYPVSGRIPDIKKWPDIRLAGYPAHAYQVFFKFRTLVTVTVSGSNNLKIKETNFCLKG